MRENESVGNRMRIFSVAALPMILLAFQFWTCREKVLREGQEKEKKIFLAYVLLSEVLLLVLAGRLIGEPDGEGILSQGKRTACVSALFVAAYVDLKEKIIPNRLLAESVGYWAVVTAAEFALEWDAAVQNLILEALGAIGIFLVCAIFLLVMKNSIGMGDIKLFMVMGLYLGLSSMMNALLLSFILMFFFALILLVLRKKGRKDDLPFAPAALIGTYLSVFLTGM